MRGGPGTYLWIGGTGAVATAICCFTPVLAIALAGLGVGWIAAYLDRILFPLLVLSLAAAAAGLWRLRACRRCSGTPI
jgi:mercuric ion transport protein